MSRFAHEHPEMFEDGGQSYEDFLDDLEEEVARRREQQKGQLTLLSDQTEEE